MRNILIPIVFISLLNIRLWAQPNSPNPVNHKLIKVAELTVLDSIYDKFNNKETLEFFVKSGSQKEVKNIAKFFYLATEKDPVAKEKNFQKRLGNINTLKKRSLTSSTIPLGVVRSNLLMKMDTVLPHDFYSLASTDYLLKVKILSFKTDKMLVNPEDKTSFSVLYNKYECVIEDIIKGSNRFSIGDKLTFFYVPFLGHGPNKQFIINKSYFLPLEVTVGDGNYDWLRLKFLDNKSSNPSSGYFPIENNIVKDQNNYFGFGKDVLWENFKKNFTDDISIIKSWRR